MRNQQKESASEISICELAQKVNADLHACKSDPGWKFSTNNSTGIDYGRKATVLNPKDIPLQLDEESVPEAIRAIVLRRYELEFGTANGVKNGALEAVAA